MKKILYGLVFVQLFAVVGCRQPTDMREGRNNLELPRIAIAGLAIESSTFSPALTHEEAFHG